MAGHLTEIAGVDVNVQNSEGNSPLHLTVQNYGDGQSGHWDILDILFEMKQSNPNLTNMKHETPLLIASTMSAAGNGAYESVIDELLERAHADVNIADVDGNTPLHVLCWYGRLKTVRDWLDTPDVEVDTSIRNRFGLRPQDVAAMQGHTELAEYLASLQQS
mmetsp:Transcript_23195/g.64719  ORF Transcript_23195/g.64719 Transcript_23195/m.64719 type:complete len:162 (-) Transcript_23195:709-1194(-)